MNSDTIVVERSLSLKDQSPFIVIMDNFQQSSQYLVEEIVNRSSNIITAKIYLSFETFQPNYLTKKDLFVDCLSLNGETDIGFAKVLVKIKEYVVTNSNKSNKKSIIEDNSNSIVDKLTNSLGTNDNNKILIIIDSLNYFSSPQISSMIGKLMRIYSNFVILSTYHTSMIDPINEANNDFGYYPNKLSLLNYVATSVYEMILFNEKTNENNDNEDEEFLNSQYYKNFLISNKLNNHKFRCKLSKFKKSGKKLQYEFIFNKTNHEFSLFDPNIVNIEEDESLLKDLSTFNLTTTDKQKLAKNQVELPFLEAQNLNDNELGSGAIVYQFEKDDDYDEEDPFEDPF